MSGAAWLASGAAPALASPATPGALAASPGPVATLRPDLASGERGPIALPPGFVVASDPRAALAFAALPLDEAETRANAASPELAGALARVRESAAALALARDATEPSLASNYVQAPQGNPPGANIISRIVTVGLQLNVSDLLSGNLGARAAAASFRSAQSDALAALRGERVRTIGLYYDALKARALASASDDALDLARRQERAARLRFAAGDAPRLDVDRATVATARAEADDEQTDASDANATDALQIETGDDLARFDAIALAVPAAPPIDTDPGRAVAAALASRPEIASATSLVEAARATGRAATRSRLPVLTVTPGETIGTDSGVPIAAPSLNAQLSFPLANLGSRAARDGDAARVDEAQTRLEAARRTATVEVAASARTLAAAERAARATTRAAASARAALTATELGYRSGASSGLDVALAQQTYRGAVADDYAARLDLAKAEATLAVQVGR